MKFKGLILLILGVALSAAAGPNPPRPSNEEFLKIARAHWEFLLSSPPPSHAQKPSKISAGDTVYVPIRDLIRGQDEISIDNIFAKLSERVANGDVIWNSKKNSWELAHDHGQSSIPLKDPIQVVKGEPGLVITDGHHDLYLALFLGAETIPVDVQEDLSDLSPLEFWKNLKQKEKVYLKETASELVKSVPNMEQIRDNPNRYLASLIALKISAKMKEGAVDINKIKGSDSAVWVKVNDSIPFIEFYIAKHLSAAGITYESSWGATVPADVIEKVRQVLIAAKKTDANLNSIPILETSELAFKARNDKKTSEEIVESVLPAAPSSLANCGHAFE